MNARDAISDTELQRMDEAAHWLEVLRDRTMDEGTLAAWLKWSSSPENLQEFERLQQIWDGVAQLNPPADKRSRQIRIVPSRRLALAASVTLLVGATASLAWYMLGNKQVRNYDTAVAVTSNIPLADGSKVQLGPLSEINAHLTDTARVVDMRSGEAYFDVAKDSARPFIVDAGAVRVTAIGTAFNVRKGSGGVRVTVTEGAIQVAAAQADGQPLVEARAGQQVEYSLSDRRLSVSGTDPRVATAWRSGVLKFVDEPLSDVVADLNRYTERKIVVDDAELGALPYTGTVFTGRIEQWLLALQDAFPLYVEDGNGSLVRLKAR